MGCGCAARMRKYIMPAAGYTLVEVTWTHPTWDPILDTDVEQHHTRLTLKVFGLYGRTKFKTWYSDVIGHEFPDSEADEMEEWIARGKHEPS